MTANPRDSGVSTKPRRRAIRKLVSLTPDTVAAVERFRRSEEMREVRCACGNVIGMRAETDLPSESETLARLIEIGLGMHERGGSDAQR